MVHTTGSKMLRYLGVGALIVAPLSHAADLPSDPPSVDDATAVCRYLTRKKLGNPPGLVWSAPRPATKDARGNWTARVGYHADGIKPTTAVCKLRPFPHGELRPIP
jgi:hypothetical protein